MLAVGRFGHDLDRYTPVPPRLAAAVDSAKTLCKCLQRGRLAEDGVEVKVQADLNDLRCDQNQRPIRLGARSKAFHDLALVVQSVAARQATVEQSDAVRVEA